MKHTDRAHINERMKTGLDNSNRAAGMGILYDRYDEESGLPKYGMRGKVTFPSDYLTKEELAALNGEVVVYKIGGEA